MQTASEIQSCIKNIRYYIEKIEVQARQQLDIDENRSKAIVVFVGPGSIRFDCLGLILADCTWLETYCKNMEVNLVEAIKQDHHLAVGDVPWEEEMSNVS